MPEIPDIPKGPYDTPKLNQAWRLGWARAWSPCPNVLDRPPDIEHNLLEPYNVGFAHGTAARKLHDGPTPIP